MLKGFLIYLVAHYIFLEITNFVFYKDKPLYKQIWDEIELGYGYHRYFAIVFLLLFGWVMFIMDYMNGKFNR